MAPLLADEAWWVRSAAKETLQASPAHASATLLDYLEHEDAFARNGAAEVLQNTGVLDELVARAVDRGSDADLDELAQVLAAGGRQLVTATTLRSRRVARPLIAELARTRG